MILGIESTAHTFGCGVVNNGKILSNIKDSYTTEKGGIIPMEAARHHCENKNEIYFEALDTAGIAPQAYPEKSSKKIFTKGKNKLDKWLLLSWKRFILLVVIWIVAVVMHNLIYAFFIGVLGIEFEEPVFFIIATIVIPAYFIISVVYSLIKKRKGVKKK